MSTLSIGADMERDVISAKARDAFRAFPVSVTLRNETARALILPEVKIKMPANSAQTIHFEDEKRMKRAVSSLAQIAHLVNASPLATLTTVNVAQPDHQNDAHETAYSTDNERVRVIHDDAERFVVELNGVQFEPNRNQVREDGTLTAGGRKVYASAQEKRAN